MRLIRNLVLAMINATLLLAAICLFLLWQLSGTVEKVAASFAGNLQVLEPVTTEIGGLRSDLAAMKADLATMGETAGGTAGASAARIEARLTTFGTKLDAVQTRIDNIASEPERLMRIGVETASKKAGETILNLSNCALSDDVQPETVNG
ncbi:hypothetical protein [Shimia biformata]|uniref:hypothetical protein n=1 Tax=Shimia biformata TaxID=1294299 RepID=UPI00194FEF7E|nr:hypothetical protein [Shimia biformata]